jgi:hypothetical protein
MGYLEEKEKNSMKNNLKGVFNIPNSSSSDEDVDRCKKY